MCYCEADHILLIHLTLCDGLIPLHRHHPLEKVSGIMFLLRKIKAETCLSTLKSTMYIPVSDRGIAPLIHVDIWFLELRVVVAGFYCVYRCCCVHIKILLIKFMQIIASIENVYWIARNARNSMSSLILSIPRNLHYVNLGRGALFSMLSSKIFADLRQIFIEIIKF